MRTTLAAVLLCGCLAATTHAGDREDALAVIDQAVQAHGGADALAKCRTAVRSGEGVIYQGEKPTPFTDVMTLDLPDRWRDAVEIDKKIPFSIAISGDKGWQSVNGAVSDVGAERLKELREEMYILWLETLLPLHKDGFDLAPAAEVKVNDRPAVGVKAASKGHGEVKLYFDKESHLLVKVERVSEELGLKLNKEYVFGGHKEFDGVQMPTHLVETLGGKKVSELTSASYKFPSRPDDAAFAKP